MYVRSIEVNEINTENVCIVIEHVKFVANAQSQGFRNYLEEEGSIRVHVLKDDLSVVIILRLGVLIQPLRQEDLVKVQVDVFG